MRISEKVWRSFTERLRKVDNRAAEKMVAYMESHGFISSEERKALLEYAYGIATKYGEGSAELSCQMYDAVAEASGKRLPPAVPARTASYGEVSKAVNGALLLSQDPKVTGAAVGRLVKMAGVDTTMQNAIRDGAEWAWIPSGDSCNFCLMLASQGWVKASKKAIENGHAKHVHSNCDCTYAVRYDGKSSVEGYDPDALREIWDSAEGRTGKEKLRFLDRQSYAANKDAINAQKRAAYARRKDRMVASELGELHKPKSMIGDYSDMKPLTLSEVEKQHLRELRELGKENGFENGRVIYKDDSFTYCCNQSASQVQMPIDRPNETGVKLYHNHTNISLTSMGDMRRLTEHQVDEIAAVLPNGEVYTVSIGYGQRPTKEEYDAFTDDLSNRLKTDMLDYPGFDEWTYEEKQYMYFRERTRLIAGYYEWELRGGMLDE